MDNARTAIDRMTRDLRQACSISPTSGTATAVTETMLVNTTPGFLGTCTDYNPAGAMHNDHLPRKIVSVGRSGTQRARLLGVMKLDLNHLLDSSSTLKLWTLGRVVQCPSTDFTATNPTSGCPSV